MASEESVAAELAEVFNFKNLSDGRDLLSRLEYGKEDSTKSYFIDFIKNLPVLRNFGVSSNSDEAMIIKIKGLRRKTNNVLAVEKKSGLVKTMYIKRSGLKIKKAMSLISIIKTYYAK